MSEACVVFLDRDGTITAETGDYITHPDALQILPGALPALRHLTEAGWRLFLFTNQAGVGRGYLSLETLEAIHARLQAEIEKAGGELEGIYFCPHHPDDGCECRKPKAGLLLQAAQEHRLDLSKAYVVGDSARDIVAGHRAGAKTILVQTGHTHAFDPQTFPLPHPDYVFPSLLEASEWLLTQSE